MKRSKKRAGFWRRPSASQQGRNTPTNSISKRLPVILDVTGPDYARHQEPRRTVSQTHRRTGAGDFHKHPDSPIHYHGHNTDGNEIGRIVAAAQKTAQKLDASDHALTGFYGPPPSLTVVNTLEDYGYEAVGLDKQAVIETSNKPRHERLHYRDFESQFFGFDPTSRHINCPAVQQDQALNRLKKADSGSHARNPAK